MKTFPTILAAFAAASALLVFAKTPSWAIVLLTTGAAVLIAVL